MLIILIIVFEFGSKNPYVSKSFFSLSVMLYNSHILSSISESVSGFSSCRELISFFLLEK